MSVVSPLIHISDMLDTIEAGLQREEDGTFPDKNGFLNAAPSRSSPFFRHRYQFPFAYLAFIFGFPALAAYSEWR